MKPAEPQQQTPSSDAMPPVAATTPGAETASASVPAPAAPAAPVYPPDRLQSPYSLGENLARVLWYTIGWFLFRLPIHNAYGWRAWLLRRFGARLGRNVRIRRTVHIEMPWNLTIGDGTIVGDYAILYTLGPVTIGCHVTISQYAHICAGTHDASTRAFRLVRSPITIGDDVWIAADAFVGPNVTIGPRTIVGARASAFSDLPPDVVAVGNPAKVIKARVLHDDDPATR